MRNILYVLTLLLFAGCASKKDVLYFQDLDQTTLDKIDSIYTKTIIEVNDILSVTISALDQTSVQPFLFGHSIDAEAGNAGYLVNSSGAIQFPILGAIKVAGESTESIQNIIQDSLARYISNPIVKVSLLNFKFTILGGINSPGTYTVPEGSITILQAIGMAGDLNINGKRKELTIIRQVNGERRTASFDLTKSDVLNSEYYYLKQNDIIYIKPNYAAVKSAGAVGDFTELLRVITVATTTYLLFTR